MLLGESGGAPPAGNMEGNEVLALELLALLLVAEILKGEPAFASSTNDFTCTENKLKIRTLKHPSDYIEAANLTNMPRLRTHLRKSSRSMIFSGKERKIVSNSFSLLRNWSSLFK